MHGELDVVYFFISETALVTNLTAVKSLLCHNRSIVSFIDHNEIFGYRSLDWIPKIKPIPSVGVEATPVHRACSHPCLDRGQQGVHELVSVLTWLCDDGESQMAVINWAHEEGSNSSCLFDEFANVKRLMGLTEPEGVLFSHVSNHVHDILVVSLWIPVDQHFKEWNCALFIWQNLLDWLQSVYLRGFVLILD